MEEEEEDDDVCRDVRDDFHCVVFTCEEEEGEGEEEMMEKERLPVEVERWATRNRQQTRTP